MLFIESFITDAGKLLLARAAAQEGRIEWTQAATSNNPNAEEYTTDQMNSMDNTSFGTKTSSGVVTNAIANDSQDSATIYAELTNEYYNGEARMFGAWAKIEGDNSDVLAIVARCGSGVTPTTINPASQGVVKAFVDFELLISAEQAQAVQVSEGWYATQAALQTEAQAREALAGRVVTTHKAGNSSQGDTQTILGQKTFIDNIIGNLIGNVTGNLTGLIPHATFNPQSVPVGSILLLIIERKTSVSSPVTIYWGECVSEVSGGDYNVYGAKLSISGGAVQATDNGGSFRGEFVLMSTVTFSAQWDRCLAMGIKTANP